TAEMSELRLAGWQAERLHGDVDPGVQVPGVDGVDAVLELALLLEEGVHLLVAHRFGEAHAELLELSQQRAGPFDRDLDGLLDRAGRAELRLLGEVADADARVRPRFPDEVLIDARHDPQQGALAGAVAADD